VLVFVVRRYSLVTFGYSHLVMSFLFNISATAEASDFKFGAQLGFAKDHHKSHAVRGRGYGLGQGRSCCII